MYVLGAMSVAALALVIYFAVVLRQEAVLPAGFLRDLRDALLAGRDEEARALCRRDRSAIAAVAAAGLAYLRREAAPDPALLREVLESEGSRQAVEIQNRTQYLLDLAVIAPMVGLLGTVVGMLRAFNAVALDLARARPMVLAGGVSQALITTVGGLVVAIPAMACYAYFRNRGTRLVALLETGAAELLTLLLAKKAP
jgi:biopolymer transport protein ExbB